MDHPTLKQIYLLDMRKCLADVEHENAIAARESQLGAWLSDHTAAINWHFSKYEEAKALLMGLND
jgi:hypothetical protein